MALVDHMKKLTAAKPERKSGRSEADHAFDALADALGVPQDKRPQARDALAYYLSTTEDD